MFKNLTSKTIIKISLSLLVVLMASVAPGVAPSVALGQQRTTSASATVSRATRQSGSDAITVFRSARDLITDGEWAKAQETFSEYVTSYQNEKNIDAALYWLAYTQYKLARFDQCRSTIDRLLQKYPNTTWRDDARVLVAQVPGNYAIAYEDLLSAIKVSPAIAMSPAETAIVYAPAEPMSAVAVTPVPGQVISMAGLDGFNDSADNDDPCEFKIVVLQALFQSDLQRGIMAATDWLKPGSTQTVRCKSAALTLLGRNGGKSVTPVILGVARNEPDLKLRARAISALGATNDDTVIDALREFALNSQENNVVEAAVYALSKHTGDRAITVLGEIAASGKIPAQRKLAISSIATRPGEPAVDALFRIYDADQTLEIRKAVISAFANRK